MAENIIEFDSVLARLRDLAGTELDKGQRFERLVADVLRTATQFATQFDQVWLWDDWPGAAGAADTGIDIVAERSDGLGLTAIQCKFYADEASLTLDDVGSYFGLLGGEEFVDGLIVTTAAPSKNLLNTAGKHSKHVGFVSSADLATSGIDWARYNREGGAGLGGSVGVRRSTRTPRPHQRDAIEAVVDGFVSSDRGQLIMACGTGKTFTGQAIAETVAGVDKSVLVLLPSISLLSQTLKEWGAWSSIPMTPFAVCSDSKAGKRSKDEDISPFDLVVAPTTDPAELVANVARVPQGHTRVVFSTYHSTPVISAAQQAGLGEFDLVIADEAHRTTGVTLSSEDDSNFTKVHDDEHIAAAKRLYMTATPRVYSEESKAQAGVGDAWLASMDDEATFGPVFFKLGFRSAVDRGLLTDYKVLVLAVDEGSIASSFQTLMSDEDNELTLDSTSKLVGVINALRKHDPSGASFNASDTVPMRTALAFSNTIRASNKFVEEISTVSDFYNNNVEAADEFEITARHVDGSHNSLERESRLAWLAHGAESEVAAGDETAGDGTVAAARLLSNARCLTEGVDVPALDAVVFLEPRGSMVDVIQAVGRVMRLAEGKKLGYVVVPIAIPAGVAPSQALASNKAYKTVWQVLNALRSHDDRMNAVVNQLDLNNEAPEMIEVQGVTFDEVAATDGVDQLSFDFPMDEVRDAIYAQLVRRVGTRHYWEDWANDIAELSQRHETRIRALVTPATGRAERERERERESLRHGLRVSLAA